MAIKRILVNLNMKLKEYKLGDLIEVTRGMSLPGEFYSTEGEYIRLTCGNFDYVNNSFKENKSKDDLYYVGKIKPEFIMEKGDIITPLTEQAIGLLGSTAIIPESGKYIQSQDVAKVTCKKGMIDHDFAYYLIPSKCVKEQLSAAAQQTKIRHTSPDAIKACKVFVPPLSEQKKIASVLSALDEKIALNKKMNQKLETMAKRLYDYWFVQYDFPDKNGHPYKTTGGPMTYNPTLKREIPVGWEVDVVGNVCETVLGGTPSTENESFWNGDIPWLNSGEVAEFPILNAENRITENAVKNSATAYLPAGSVTLSITRHLRPSIMAIDACINQSVAGMKENDILKNGYLYPYLVNEIPRLNTLRGGAQQPHINKDTVDKSPIVIPAQNVLHQYYEKVNPLYREIIEKAKESQKLTTLRDKLLPLLMNGQVEVL